MHPGLLSAGGDRVADVFISFASQDRRVAMTLCNALESRGFKCWISSRDIMPGENFQSAIVKAIRTAKIMLLVFTANSNNSDEMSKELALASQNKLMVVPLRIEDVAPNDAFAYEFATRQWIDFFADWELAMQQLADRLGHATTAQAPRIEPAPIAVVATDKDASGAKPSPEIETAAEASEAADDGRTPDVAHLPVASKSRLGIYAAVSVILLLIVGLSLLAPTLRHEKARPPEARAMVAIPAPAVAVANPVAAEPPPPADAAEDHPVAKPAKHKASAPAKPVDEIPY